MAENISYAVVAENGTDTIRRFPHHKEGTEVHTHESVDLRLLVEGLLSARAAGRDAPDEAVERGIAHLESHATALGFSALTDRADIQEDIWDELRQISYDFENMCDAAGMGWWDRPYIVDYYDTYVVARGCDCRYYMYTYTKKDSKYEFGDPVEVEKKWVTVGGEGDDTDESAIEAAAERLIAHFDEAMHKRKKNKAKEGEEDGSTTAEPAADGEPTPQAAEGSGGSGEGEDGAAGGEGGDDGADGAGGGD